MGAGRRYLYDLFKLLLRPDAPPPCSAYTSGKENVPHEARLPGRRLTGANLRGLSSRGWWRGRAFEFVVAWSQRPCAFADECGSCVVCARQLHPCRGWRPRGLCIHTDSMGWWWGVVCVFRDGWRTYHVAGPLPETDLVWGVTGRTRSARVVADACGVRTRSPWCPLPSRVDHYGSQPPYSPQPSPPARRATGRNRIASDLLLLAHGHAKCPATSLSPTRRSS